MRREGSPWQGLGAVTLKELSDHLTSWRMLVLEWLVVFTALISVYLAIRQITGDGPSARAARTPFAARMVATRWAIHRSPAAVGCRPPCA